MLGLLRPLSGINRVSPVIVVVPRLSNFTMNRERITSGLHT